MKRLFLLLALLLAGPAFAQGLGDGPKVHARLVAEQAVVAPGGSVTIALEEQIAPGWHTYWKNPGDAGAPTEIAWTLPPGWKANAIQWPRPKRLPVGPLMDYGYEGKLWLLSRLTAPADAQGPVTIKAAVSWLVCREVCIPEDTVLTITLPVGGGESRRRRGAGFRGGAGAAAGGLALEAHLCAGGPISTFMSPRRRWWRRAPPARISFPAGRA